MPQQDSIRGVDPRHALRRLRGCLLLELAHDDERRTVTLTAADYPERAAGSDRGFVMLRFDGVTHFSIERGGSTGSPVVPELHRTSEGGSPVEVEDIEPADGSAGGVLSLWLSRLGGVHFRYASAVAKVRDAVVIQSDDRFVYRDAISQRELSFYRPFT